MLHISFLNNSGMINQIEKSYVYAGKKTGIIFFYNFAGP